MTQHGISLHSRRKLKPRDAQRFQGVHPALFAEIAALVCRAGVIPQKELHECWQMACRVHEAFPESRCIADMAAGHGLLGWILVLLAYEGERPFLRRAVAVDITRPPSARILAQAFASRWPDLKDALHYVEGSVEAVHADPGEATLFVAAHACGSLSDHVLMTAIRSGSPLAIMPCCHSLRKQVDSLSALASLCGLAEHQPETCGAAALVPAIDDFRKKALSSAGYDIQEAFIQPEITAFHRIIMARPTAKSTRHWSGTPNREALCAGSHNGMQRAFQSAQSINVADEKETGALAQRPSRSWHRSFDLSFWVRADADGPALQSFLESELHGLPWQTSVRVHDRFVQAATGQLALTFRLELQSSSVAIEKSDAVRLRQRLCEALENRLRFAPGSFTLRDPHFQATSSCSRA